MAVETLPMRSFPDGAAPPSPPSTAKHSQSPSLAGERQDASSLPPLHSQKSALLKSYPLPPRNGVKSVQPQDLKTPDAHVERDPRLIRLTGVHPLNCEAPLSDLYDEGFLTSEDLHFVRNHGSVPACEDEEVLDWTFSVEGMVRRPFSLSVRELVEGYEQATYPVTLVCAGNRRKEQNVVRKSKGFSWGAAGLSTALWTGVPVGELLAAAGGAVRGARYVCFEGADELPNGHYGTSVKLNWCLNEDRGIMVAHRMNGRALHPDHGKPVRVVIPGQIGGRSVKWLKRIIVTREPSDNWYHIYDNRVLPTMITPEQSANLPDVWKDEKYAIYDLNTNSAVCYPQHDEMVPLDGSNKTYKVRGYAYSGGGKRVTRLEVTLDKGRSWRLALINYPEDEYRNAADGDELYGGKMDVWWRETCFCWCFWELDIPVGELAGASDLMIRAMDEGLMAQPRDMYWSVLGMMNNPWYRLVIHKEDRFLRFEHPTQPALMLGGWMERVKKAGGNIANGFWGEKTGKEEEEEVEVKQEERQISMISPETKRTITLAELEQHGGEEEPWFVVEGQVYDGTEYLDDHPGGATSIFAAAATDCTEEFLAIHSENAKAMLPKYHIGTLDEHARAALAGKAAEVEDAARPVFLQAKAWSRARLCSKVDVSPDSKLFSFALDHDQQTIGLPVGQHVLMRLRDPATREAIIRAYTPISRSDARGTLDFVVKIYPPTATQAGGVMTTALDSIPVGHPVDFKGPVGRFEYAGDGLCRVAGRARHVDRLVMVCAGTGVTPMLAVLRAVVGGGPEDATECVVLDGNRTEEDILCRAELEALVGGSGGRARLVHTLSEPGEGWRGRRGRMDRVFLEGFAGRPPQKQQGSDDGEEEEEEEESAMALVCGPKALEDNVLDILKDLGWDEDDILFF
ncbi:nitrate reductase [Cordyceps fumosorosea ARSEF 2679]|uniref:Nitrate reductase n=1 Tax=Cordyceps fumosorosea (strain ARSEF 2679) TaxID=1081104 RepID=A0A167RLM9_CORFA|nr:nitrate reductase [Cordyceps fumosorosea ARSEF 2679]OAA58718.1 nitrate reductase [Cordyceps fumosorosea ARSEF 2679]